MIIDLPLGADQNVISRAADKVGVRLEPIGSVRRATPRDIGEQMLRIEGVSLRPIDDGYRAYSEAFDPQTNQPILGRRKHAVCWHGHREWMRAIFREYPAAAIRSSLITYVGSDDFEHSHKPTRPTSTRSGMCACKD